MKKEKVFYYHFDKINAWFIFNMALLITLTYASVKCYCLLFWWQTQVLWSVLAYSWLTWGYKYLMKHQLAVINDKTITIDHCRPLAWKDIDRAEERIVRCGFRKLKVIVLLPREGLKYQYNFLQKHNGAFTPFSIPLYEIVSPEDADELAALIADKVKLVKLPAA